METVEMNNQELIDQYISDLELFTDSKATIKHKRSVLERFSRQLGKSFTEFTDNDIKDWMRNHANLKPASVQTYLRHLKVFFSFLEDEGYISHNPVTRTLKRYTRSNHNSDNRREVFVSVEDIRKIILTASDLRDRTMLLLFYKTGMRLNELTQLTVQDVDINRRTINIPRRKGGKPGWVCFDIECQRYLQRWLMLRPDDSDALFTSWRGNRLNERWVQRIVTETCKEAGFDNLTTHSFRHIFTTHLQANRCHVEVIRILRGDSSGGMVSYYTHFSVDDVREEYDKCIPRLGV